MKTYKSKFGYKLMLFLTLLFGSMLVFMIYKNEPLEAILSVGGIFLAIYLFVLYINFSTIYTITDAGVLIVKSGFVYNQRFDIQKIKSVRKTTNIMSSPAPSLDRLELTYGKFDIIVISPKNKIDFARELKKINPRIKNDLEILSS
ncbi:hypothetical protein FNB79_16290 [Formosa sediminum]|uniref:Uncharacterized protein YyaB-like PH domain-containing protein n=1 Tax=Formosa sediminum TaxID=2594004 RepID=A0A516GVB8_9FLAO|nr:PH domain-containing protein [Formosa sediminum]QDO95462.1 hypothetical protein FNB79_16290 [Formosa sediminum]